MTGVDTSTARGRILTKIRAATPGLPVSDHPAPVPAQAQTMGADLRAQFMAKARAADARVTECARESLASEIAAALRARNMPNRLRIGADPRLAPLLESPELDASVGPGRADETAAVSWMAAGVAETGTLALRSGPDNPVTLAFLPETHMAVVDSADLVAGFEDLWARLRADGRDSRTLNLITGPSRTADIEQTLTLGAHGPKELHIFVVDS